MSNRFFYSISFVVIGLLLALDWAAIHDITTGRESNLDNEYAMILFSLILLGTLFYIGRKRKRKLPE